MCEIQREAPGKTRLLTMEDWQKAGSFDRLARPGDEVTEEIVEEFRDCVPPVNNGRSVMQCGEPYDYRFDPERKINRATYTTFELREGRWYYCGFCFLGHTTQVDPVGATT